jgi:acyl-coenzyme A synthetase/AMP-(fatty) acid ligase
MNITASQLGVPEIFNAATHFIDRNVADGRGARVAIEYGDERITYDDVLRNVNRCADALRGRLGLRPEERVLILLHDCPAFVYAFFGAIKIGAVPVPLNTLWKAADYEFVIRDARASVLIVGSELLPQIESIPLESRECIRHLIVVGSADATHTHTVFGALLAQGSARVAAERTSRDAPAFWLYSSGSTGTPKGCVHLQHDMVVCAELFGKGILGIAERDRTGLEGRPPVSAISICRPSASRCPQAKHCRLRSMNASSSASASTSSTASGQPKHCTCSSPIVPARSVPDRAARSWTATARESSMTRDAM